MQENPLVALTALTQANQRSQEVETSIAEGVRANPLIAAASALETLTDEQEQFLTYKLLGMSDKAAIKLVGMSEGSVQNWKHKEDFKQVYDSVTQNPLMFAADITAFSTVKAIMKLTELLDHQNVNDVKYAIDTLLRIGGLSKERIEVTKKEEKSIKGEDVDELIRAYEERKRTGASDGGNAV